MLVLTRKRGEKILIGKDIEITLLEIKGDSAKLGIKAPKGIDIYREEIYKDVEKSNKLGTNPNVDIQKLAKLIIKKD
ncbi:carbon storage regulator, CsrA [Anaerobranca californiensis DSM 14826]|jgi:carbon storage regulator|uniref:Translational regulator CsrA n=1 Tax=Anaerobranca californiensis DSM 14826 TaxID=1120989 RepID=A0A1M6Q1F8_9FIRM|nr:carbon storage regulator CsrA [Anaerobranca californiensis]SHK14085.1 carbon storage regulator, CsrA [Anaerobranca californiensis DSM 14826]